MALAADLKDRVGKVILGVALTEDRSFTDPAPLGCPLAEVKTNLVDRAPMGKHSHAGRGSTKPGACKPGAACIQPEPGHVPDQESAMAEAASVLEGLHQRHRALQGRSRNRASWSSDIATCSESSRSTSVCSVPSSAPQSVRRGGRSALERFVLIGFVRVCMDEAKHACVPGCESCAPGRANSGRRSLASAGTCQAHSRRCLLRPRIIASAAIPTSSLRRELLSALRVPGSPNRRIAALVKSAAKGGTRCPQQFLPDLGPNIAVLRSSPSRSTSRIARACSQSPSGTAAALN